MTIRVRPLVESDLDEADRIMRLAFGTFMGLPDPMAMWGDGGYAHSRWRSDPEGALAAEHNGRLAGSNFAVRSLGLCRCHLIRAGGAPEDFCGALKSVQIKKTFRD